MTVESSHRDTGIRFLLVAACVVVIIAGLRAAAPIILPFLIAVFLAVVNVPLMNWLMRNRVPKSIAVVLTILFGLAGIAVSLPGGAVWLATRDKGETMDYRTPAMKAAEPPPADAVPSDARDA